MSYDYNQMSDYKVRTLGRSFLLAENNFDVKTGVENGEIGGLRS